MYKTKLLLFGWLMLVSSVFGQFNNGVIVNLPAPPVNSVQFNNAGAFGGSSFFLVSPTAIGVPTAPTVNQTGAGTPGATAYSYELRAYSAIGVPGIASTAGSTATGNATLDNTNWNNVVTVCGPLAAGTPIAVYRSVGGPTQGRIDPGGLVCGDTLQDKGLVGEGIDTSIPYNSTGVRIAGVLYAGNALENEDEIDFNGCCYGQATGLSVSTNGDAVNNFINADAFPGINDVFYVSRGTVETPSDINSTGAFIHSVVWMYYFNDIFGAASQSSFEVRPDGGGDLYGINSSQVYKNQGAAVLSEALDGVNGAFNLGLTISTPLIGFTPISAGIGEFNNGTAVSKGGTLGQFNLGTSNAALYKTATNCADSAGAAACGSAAAGAVVIDAGATTVVVSTTAVTANSEILVMYDSSLSARLSVTCNATVALPVVTARTAGTSFTITVPVAPIATPACYNYWIVN